MATFSGTTGNELTPSLFFCLYNRGYMSARALLRQVQVEGHLPKPA